MLTWPTDAKVVRAFLLADKFANYVNSPMQLMGYKEVSREVVYSRTQLGRHGSRKEFELSVKQDARRLRISSLMR
jgi:hypothetical protein